MVDTHSDGYTQWFIFNMCALKFLVDKVFGVWLARLINFIHADISLLVSEFVVGSFYLRGGYCQPLCGHIPVLGQFVELRRDNLI